MTNLREAAQQALAFTMRDFASLRDFEASKAVLHDNLRAALAQPAEPVEPVAWLVMDESGYVQHAASWRDAAHEHINDAINEHDLVCARTWRVVPVYTAPPRCPNCASLEAQNTELDRRLAELERAESAQEPVDVGLLEYRGNSVAFIHQKMTAYRAGIDAAWDAFRANGLHPDGKTSLADMIAKHTAPPRRKPLTEDVAALTAQRDALLEALKKMRIKYGEYACRVCDQADAAIKAVEETK